jgi:hypothetical protein
MGLLELAVLFLFLSGAFGITIGRNWYLHKQDEKQEIAIADLMLEAHGQDIQSLHRKLGNPYEVDAVSPEKAFHVWKFPPSNTIPPGRGLIVLTAVTDNGTIVDIGWRRRR